MWYFDFIDSESTCSVHLVNDGVTINGNNVSIEFTGVGPVNSCIFFIDNIKSQFCKPILLILMIIILFIGNSPILLSNLKPGEHNVMIRPRGCRNRHHIPFIYTINIEEPKN